MKPNKTIGYSDGLVWLCRLDIFRFSTIFIKGRIAGVEILAVQMLLRPTESVTDLTISNNCHFQYQEVTVGILKLFVFL